MIGCPNNDHTFVYNDSQTARVCTWCELLEIMQEKDPCWVKCATLPDGRKPNQLIIAWDKEVKEKSIKEAGNKAAKWKKQNRWKWNK